jgi:hypothetical protein
MKVRLETVLVRRSLDGARLAEETECRNSWQRELSRRPEDLRLQAERSATASRSEQIA